MSNEASEAEVITIDDGDDVPEKAGGNLETVDDAEVEVDRRDRATEVHQNIRDLKEQETEIFTELARNIYRIHRNSYYTELTNEATGKKFQSFKEYVEFEVGYSKRKANYYVQLWDYYVEQHSEEFLDDLKHLGWTKLTELVDEITPDNKDEWLEIAENSSVRELKQEIKQLNNETDPSDEPTPDDPDMKTEQTHRVIFQMDDPQKDSWDQAANIASNIADIDNKSEALELITQEFIGGNQDLMDEKDYPLETLINRFETNVGLSLIAQNKGEMVYGSVNDVISIVSNALGSDPEVVLESIEEQLGVSLIGIDENSGEIAYGEEVIEDFVEDDEPEDIDEEDIEF